MRNPNGYGSVVKLSGNRRRPWCARKTAGWNDKGYPIYKAIGYYANKKDAMIALADYNRHPFDIDLAKITMKELYERWVERDLKKFSKGAAGRFKYIFKKAEKLHNIPYREIKAYQMQEIIDNCGYGYSTQGAIKNLFGQLDKFALELDIIYKSNAALVSAAPVQPADKVPFTDEEIQRVWDMCDKEWVDSVLFFLYTGFRNAEVLNFETANVDLENMTLKGGSKSKAGKNRIVPIHPRIESLVRKRVAEGNKYLFSSAKGEKVSTSKYYLIWYEIMKDLGTDHTPHECRHTFRSKLDSAGANKVCIDLLMGHKSSSVGERVYTHKTLQELRDTILLIK